MAVQSEAIMRCLVSCAGCRRQYDATGFAAKSRFHCSCGEVVEVPRFLPHDADVVRCSSCSAPRGKGSLSCKHCGADYTLHEQDLQTICPSCMTRVSDRARYCHHCATPIVPQGEVGKQTRQPCPACGRRHKLHSRDLGEHAVTVCECTRCAGIWLQNAGFELLAERARSVSVDEAANVQIKPSPEATQDAGAKGQSLYRRCPECETLMHRRNFGHGSRVVVDTCKDHGIWFDSEELDAVLKWIQGGGEARTARKRDDDRRHRERITRLKVERDERTGMLGNPDRRYRDSEKGGLLGEFLGAFFDF